MPNFYAIYHSSRDISISGLGGHIAIFGCRSLSQSFWDTFYDVAVVGELDFVTWITTVLILDLFCHISQHDHKISLSSVSKRIHTCLTSFQTTSGASIGDWLLRFVPTSYSGKVTKGQRPMLNRFFTDSKTELGLFLKVLTTGMFFWWNYAKKYLWGPVFIETQTFYTIWNSVVKRFVANPRLHHKSATGIVPLSVNNFVN